MAPIRRLSSHTLKRILGLAMMVLAVAGATACETTREDRNEVISLINQSRAAAGIGALRENGALNNKADAWAQHLRDICSLEHSRLADGAPPEWLKLGENVGFGGTIAQVHEAYLNSPGHKANIMDRSFNYVGAAAVWGTCDGHRRVFTVQVFMKA
jgi:uncharacterized protein YkwD